MEHSKNIYNSNINKILITYFNTNPIKMDLNLMKMTS